MTHEWVWIYSGWGIPLKSSPPHTIFFTKFFFIRSGLGQRGSAVHQIRATIWHATLISRYLWHLIWLERKCHVQFSFLSHFSMGIWGWKWVQLLWLLGQTFGIAGFLRDIPTVNCWPKEEGGCDGDNRSKRINAMYMRIKIVHKKA